MVTISVIIAAYNGADVIEDTLNSMVGQDGNGSKFELDIIVVDDFSTDTTIEVVKVFPNVSLLTNATNSGGPNRGRNQGLAVAKGDYICIADQDDSWVENRILQLLPHFGKAPILTSGYLVDDTRLGERQVRVNENKQEGYVDYLLNETFKDVLTRSKRKSRQNTYLGAIVFNKSLKEIRFEEHFGQVDYDWILRLFNQNFSREISKPLYLRKVGMNNLSLNEQFQRADFHYRLQVIDSFRRDYPAEAAVGSLRTYSSRGRFHYLMNNMAEARYYLYRGKWSLKAGLYYLTSFYGSNWVRERFNIWG